MAGPHVAGVVGADAPGQPRPRRRHHQADPHGHGRDEATAGEDNTFGWGLIDAYAAVVSAMAGFGDAGRRRDQRLLRQPAAGERDRGGVGSGLPLPDRRTTARTRAASRRAPTTSASRCRASRPRAHRSPSRAACRPCWTSPSSTSPARPSPASASRWRPPTPRAPTASRRRSPTRAPSHSHVARARGRRRLARPADDGRRRDLRGRHRR